MPPNVEVPASIVDRMRLACAHLPEAYEEESFGNVRWRIRGRTLVNLVTVERPEGGLLTTMTFHCVGDERDVLLGMGDPFFPGWGDGLVAMVIREQRNVTDWDEVRELVTESYRLLAPKKLIARLDAVPLHGSRPTRPPLDEPPPPARPGRRRPPS